MLNCLIILFSRLYVRNVLNNNFRKRIKPETETITEQQTHYQDTVKELEEIKEPTEDNKKLNNKCKTYWKITEILSKNQTKHWRICSNGKHLVGARRVTTTA